jgi:hypothetical protein
MVPGDAEVAMLAQELDTFPGVRAVTHYIPQTPYLLEAPPLLCILQHRLEGGQVGVDVSQDGAAHVKSW